MLLMARASRTGNHQHGFVYIWILMALSLLGLGLGRALEIYHHELQREKEEQLLYIGNQYRLAIESYYNTSPGMEKHYPRSLDDLLLDKRMLSLKRHIRKRYRDPMTNSTEWGLIRTRDGEIIGVHSPSNTATIKRTHFDSSVTEFEQAMYHSEWHFLASPRAYFNR